MKEIWRDIIWYENKYQVSDLGNIKSLRRVTWMERNKCNRTHVGRVLKPQWSNSGYLHVRLSKENKVKILRIHQIVAVVFLNHIINGHVLVVDHINNIKTDNRLENIQVITSKENIMKYHKLKGKNV